MLPLLAAAGQLAVHERFLSLAAFTLSPLIASMVYAWRATVLWAAYALAVAVPLTLLDVTFPPALDAARLASLAPVIGLAVANSALRVHRESRLREVRAVARVAQETILRPLPPQVGGVGVQARYWSAAAEAQVGGDLYEVAPWPGGLRLVVGDVRGKGLDAVRLAARTVGSFREAAENADLSLEQVVDAVERSVARVIEAEDFVTAVFAEVTDAGVVRLLNCGHPGPVLVRALTAPVDLTPARPAVPLGLRGLLPGVPREVHEHPLPDGARLLLFSDGLIEARDRSGATFPLSDHTAGLSRGPLAQAVDRLLDAVRLFSPDLSDDVVLLALERPAPAPRAPDLLLPLARDAAGAGRVRRGLAELVEDAGLAELADDVVLAASEVVTNALVHTVGAATLRAYVAHDTVRVEVQDEAGLSGMPRALRPPAPDAAGGRGLLIVESLATHWGADPDPDAHGKSVWFCMHRGARRCADAGAGLLPGG